MKIPDVYAQTEIEGCRDIGYLSGLEQTCRLIPRAATKQAHVVEPHRERRQVS